MVGRPRRGAPGLRGRIVGVVLVTAVATLGVAAIALLGPLENSLRQAAKKTLIHDLRNVAGRFRGLNLIYTPPTDTRQAQAVLGGQYAAVQNQESQLFKQLGATLIVRGYVDASGHSQPVLASNPSDVLGIQGDSDTSTGSYHDVARASSLGKPVYGFQSIAGREYVTAVIPLQGKQKGFFLAAHKPIDEIPDAVHAVGQAFLFAGLAGLGLSLLLGVPLAARLVRRLRRLRVSALAIADGGSPGALADDRARDEIGDLARSFATMQRRLRQQEEARRAFVATASHELRTPLTSLEGMLELLDDDLRHSEPDLGDARTLLAGARAQSRRLGRLAADLLDLSRIDAEVALRSEPLELGELCRAVLAEFHLGTRARGIHTGLEDGGTPLWAVGDPGSVARILRILLDNAVRVSPEGSEVTVELAREPRPTMKVRDRGPGVEEAERELIFERFHRGRATGGDAGFGLGLAIGSELAERMGGALVLEAPDGLGGACFALTLPAAEPTEQAAAEDEPAVFRH